jgi:hypothetical protein
MHAARRRFSGRASLVVVAALALAAGVGTALNFALDSATSELNYMPALAVVAMGLLLIGLSAPAIWHKLALRALRRRYPRAAVFLARREPALVPDLPMYQYRKDNTADVADRWIPGLVDHRGLSAWSGGPRPKELLLMEWSEIGAVEATEFLSIEGRPKFGASVDVRPFATPLLVDVGHSFFGFEGAFDRAGVQAVVDASNDKRPPVSRTIESERIAR